MILKEGFILVISGPSGAGKSTLLSKLVNDFKNDLYFSVSYTTRKPRAQEIDNVHYHFIDEYEFKKGIEENKFLEWAKVHDFYYGTGLNETLQALNKGKIVIFDIDVQGFLIVKEKMQGKISSVFITTKNKQDLEHRLQKRDLDMKKEILAKRLFNAEEEMKYLREYDFLIINDSLEHSYECLKNIFSAEKLKTKRLALEKIEYNWNK